MNFPSLAEFFSGMWMGVGNHLWQSTLFACVAGLLTLTLRRNQARARYWIWLTASVKFLIPFSLLVDLGSRLAWSSNAVRAKLVMLQAMQPFAEPIAIPDAPETVWQSTMHALPALLAAVWLCGLVAVLVVWCVRCRRLAVAVRSAAPMCEGREVEALRRMERVGRIRRRMELMSSRDSLEPGVFGIFRPVLIWPEGISRHLDDAQLEAVLAHEVWHVRRRDNLTAALHMLVEAVFWFHPLVWWMEGRLVEERERACDEEVLQMGNPPQVYAEGILKVCEFCVESPLACVSGVTGADLKKRMVHIMSEQVARKLGFGSKCLLAGAAMMAIAAPIVFGQVMAMNDVPVLFLPPQALSAPPPPPPVRLASMATLAPRVAGQVSLLAEAAPPQGAAPQQAQATTSNLVGTVTDQSGAVIPGAKVSVTNVATQAQSAAVTDRIGAYRIVQLSGGAYNVSVAMQGFATSNVASVMLDGRHDARIDARLVVGSAQQHVIVTGVPPAQAVAAPLPAQSGPVRISGPVRVSGGVIVGLCLSCPSPVYPPIALAAHVQGSVVLHAILSKQGTVENPQVISGPEMLRNAAMQAVRSWQYKPYLLGAEPVEVDTTVTVEFRLAEAAPPPQAVAMPADVRHVGGGVSPPIPIYTPEPEFSEQARAVKFAGDVIVSLYVDQQGMPVNVRVIRGAGMGLDEKAVEAVKRYKFKPAMENGKPVMVDLNVIVNFQI